MKRMTQEEFIKRCVEIYGDRYVYDKVEYKNIETKVLVFCKKHNFYFETIPRNFLKGHGCPKCGKEGMAKTQSLGQEEFIKRCEKIHENRNYDFSNTVYIKASEYVTVMCHEKDIYGNEHGEFKIKAYHLLNGHGCRKCLNDLNYRNRIKPFETFVEQSIERFGDMFDFSKSNYINSKTKIQIICKKCGHIIETTPSIFLKGCGCQYCNGPSMEVDINNFLTNNNIKYIYQYKNKQMLGSLSLDFYLPEYNIAIECQGEQHFRPIKWWGGIESFNKLKERDQRKFEICKENGIDILYYSNSKKTPNDYYNEIYHDTEELLKTINEKHPDINIFSPF